MSACDALSFPVALLWGVVYLAVGTWANLTTRQLLSASEGRRGVRDVRPTFSSMWSVLWRRQAEPELEQLRHRARGRWALAILICRAVRPSHAHPLLR
jgi:hypothetical protein